MTCVIADSVLKRTLSKYKVYLRYLGETQKQTLNLEELVLFEFDKLANQAIEEVKIWLERGWPNADCSKAISAVRLTQLAFFDLQVKIFTERSERVTALFKNFHSEGTFWDDADFWDAHPEKLVELEDAYEDFIAAYHILAASKTLPSNKIGLDCRGADFLATELTYNNFRSVYERLTRK